MAIAPVADPTVTPLLPGPLFTDLYQLTMAQAWFLSGRTETRAAYDWFFRTLPFDGGYVVFAGLADLVEQLAALRFDADALAWLGGQGFDAAFLAWLADFRFQGDLFAPQEGEVVFARAPVVRVHGTQIEAQLIESLVLNVLNHQSLIATKAARMVEAAGPGRQVVDFGMRRAPGLGAISASRAAVLGGCAATSNVYAARRYGLATTGTQAHAWVQSFDDELTAFQSFAALHGSQTVLLLDTYDTLRSGLPHAIAVAKELAARGHRLAAVRLDSGDLAYLSKKVRQALDEAGLHETKIIVSNALDEHLIKSLLEQGARVDVFGVGTRLATAHDDPALDGVYKLASVDGRACMKRSDNVTKATLPGVKRVVRYHDPATDALYGDAIALVDEACVDRVFHPVFPDKSFATAPWVATDLQTPVLAAGVQVRALYDVAEASALRAAQLQRLPEEHRRFANPHVYKVGISEGVRDLRTALQTRR